MRIYTPKTLKLYMLRNTRTQKKVILKSSCIQINTHKNLQFQSELRHATCHIHACEN